MKPLRPHRPWWLVIGSIAFLTYFVLLVYCDLWRPEDPGFTFDLSRGQMTVDHVTADGPGDHAGLRVGDHILKWNNQPTSNFDMIISDGLLTIDQPMPFEIERNGTSFNTSLVLHPAPASFWLAHEGWIELMVRVIQFMSLALGMLVVWRRYTDPAARIGAWLLATFGVFCVALPNRFAAVWSQWPRPFGIVLWVPFVSTLAIAAILTTFVAWFPRRTIKSPVVIALAWVPMLVALIHPVSFMARLVYWPDTVRADSFGGKGLASVSAAYLFAGIVLLARNSRTITDLSERRRVRVLSVGVVIGCLFGLPAITLYWSEPVNNLVSTFFKAATFATGAIALLALPLAFAYAILRHRLFDVRIIIRQGLRHALARNVIAWLVPALLLPLVIELMMNHNGDPLGRALTTHVWTYLIVGAVTVGAWSQRSHWLDAIDRQFFRDRYDGQQVLRRVAEDLHNAPSVEAVAPLLMAQLESAFHAEFAAVMVRYGEATHYTSIASAPAGRAPAPISAKSKFVGLVRLLDKPIDIGIPDTDTGWLSAQLPTREIDTLRASRIDLVVPVGTPEGRSETILVLGPKRSEEPYTEDDKDLLVAIGRNLALLLTHPPVLAVPRTLSSECPECGACYDAGVDVCTRDQTPLRSLNVPRIVAGRYRLQNRLGEGGMGTVYSAMDVALDREVAVKLLRQALSTRSQVTERFHQEARAAASFAHPNVVTVHDFGATDGNPYLVMELLKGSTLRELLQVGRLPTDRVRSILRSVCGAVEGAHRRQLVHRDLKPENIFLVQTDSGEVAKVLDFGIAKYETRPEGETSATQLKTAPGIVVGTPEYMSPEQLTGADMGTGADVWALSVVAFEMLIGVHPLMQIDRQHQSLSQTWDQIAKAIDLTDASPAVKLFFTAALSIDPTARPKTPAELLKGIEGILGATA